MFLRMLVCLVHGYILFLKFRHMCDGLVKIDPCLLLKAAKKEEYHAEL